VSGPSWLDEICGRIIERLQPVEGIEAIALEGSQARDTARPDSDADMIERCCEGKADAVYQLGHPLDLQNQIHLGETHCCNSV